MLTEAGNVKLRGMQ